MNTQLPIRPHSPFKSFWIAVFVIPVALIGAGLLYIASFFFITGETRALKNAVLAGHGSHFERVVELNTGRASVLAARFGLGFVDDVPPEAKQMLAAFKKGEAAVYRVKHRYRANFAELLQNADYSMEKRGWSRVVGVCEEEAFVAIYMKEHSKGSDHLEVAAVVLDAENLVCASAEADLEPVFDLVRQKLGEEGFGKVALR